MQIKKALAAAACGIVILATACHKDKDNNNNNNASTTTPKTPTDYLTDAKWKMTGYKMFWSDADTTYDEDYYANETDDCEKDNFELYLTNGTIVDNIGAIKCDTSDETDSSSKWALVSNDAKLVFKYDGSNDTATILQLNATTLKYAMSFSYPTTTERDTITFTNVK